LTSRPGCARRAACAQTRATAHSLPRARRSARQRENVFGLLALSIVVTIALSALPPVRRRWFWLFRYVHYLFAPLILCVLL
jgi:hypothetical protein